MATSYQARLPEIVRNRAESLGKPGIQWLQTLDATIESLARQWKLTVGDVLTGGSESLVTEATTASGDKVILKLGLTGSADLAKEAMVYGLANGNGVAKLINHDEQHNAILLERLGPSLATQNLSTPDQFRVICETLQQFWIPIEDAQDLMTGKEKASWLFDFIDKHRRTLGEPCSRATIEQALGYCEARAAAHTPEAAVLVHGDAHEENTLLTLDGSGHYKLIDPDGLFAEKACDLAPIMRSWNQELLEGDTRLLTRRRSQYLAELTDLDEEAIWQWGFMERISTGFVLLQIGADIEGRQTLEVADRLTAG